MSALNATVLRHWLGAGVEAHFIRRTGDSERLLHGTAPHLDKGGLPYPLTRTEVALGYGSSTRGKERNLAARAQGLAW
jgi:hypothetical protein